MSERGRPDDSRGGYLGPVEAAGDTVVRPTPARPHPSRTRRQLLPLAALLLLVGVPAGLLASRSHTPSAEQPAPDPGQLSAVDYGGPVHEAAPGELTFTLRVLVTASGPPGFDVTGIGQSYHGLTLLVSPPLPARVTPGHPATLSVEYRVTDCAAAPPDAAQPFLDVTLRNTRAIETLSQILGDEYAHELSKNLHSACPSPGIRTISSAAALPDIRVR